MGCYAIARTDQRIRVQGLEDVLDSTPLKNALRSWLTEHLKMPVTIEQYQNTLTFQTAGTFRLTISPQGSSMFGTGVTEAELTRFIKEMSSQIQMILAINALKANGRVTNQFQGATTTKLQLQVNL